MFVQIGNQAFDPNGATIEFSIGDQESRYVELTAANGVKLEFYGKSYDAFMDWWTRCANVSKFPNGKDHRTVTVTVRRGLVEDVTGLPPTWDYQIADYDVCSNCGGLIDCPECSPEEAEVQWK